VCLVEKEMNSHGPWKMGKRGWSEGSDPSGESQPFYLSIASDGNR
jgi:hypothetical protein